MNPYGHNNGSTVLRLTIRLGGGEAQSDHWL